MPKNIVIFSDGTGQDGGETTNTNVYKLFNMIEDRTDKQIAFYDRGLGTGRQGLLGKATGKGISQNIRECYQFIFENFQAGDQIYLFGFSRGAATVRSLSSLVHYFGVLPKSRPELIQKAYRIYRISNPQRREQRSQEFVARHHTMWTRIRFLGVWDTVAALGVPFPILDGLIDRISFFKHRFHNLSLSESVQHGYHALAIDDERRAFHPTLWKRDDERVTQVWFPGMHTDVGGGYPVHELSDIALDWMIAQAQRHGLRIYPKHRVKVFPSDGRPNPDGKMHNSRAGIRRLFRRELRQWNEQTHGVPLVHQSALERRRNPNNELEPPYKPWILGQFEEPQVEPWVHYERPSETDVGVSEA